MVFPLTATPAAFRAPGCGMAPQPTRPAHDRHLLPCLACPHARMGFHPSSPSHPLPRSLLGTHSDPSAPAPGIFAPCCPHAQTAPRSLHPPWRHRGCCGPSLTMQLGRAGWAGCGPVGMDEHTRDGVDTLLGPRRPGGSGGGHTVHGRCSMRWGVGELPSGPHMRVWLLFPSGSLSHTRTGSISAVEVGLFIHRFQPP